MNGKTVIILLIGFAAALLLSACSTKKSSPLHPVSSTGIVDADNPYIQYVGRFDRSDLKKAVFDWSGVYIRARFQGPSCAIRLNDGGNLYAVTIDDQEPQVLQTDTAAVYPVAAGLADTIHTILIQKRTEASIGKGEFLGFILDDAVILGHQNRQDIFHTRLMIHDLTGDFYCITVMTPMVQDRGAHADPLHRPDRQHDPCARFDKLVFNGRRAAIQDQYLHQLSLSRIIRPFSS